MNFMFPLANYLTITQGYHSGHVGNDYGWNSRVTGGNHQPILAAESGTVITAVDGYGNTYPNKPPIYGNYVIISHGDGWYSMYAHLQKGSVAVQKGQNVTKGQQIARMGNSGYSVCNNKASEEDGQHLHFELRKGGNSKSYAVDPLDYLTVQNDLIISSNTKFPERIKKGTPTGYVGTPVAVNTKVDQVELLATVLRARKRPEMNDAVILGYANPGMYNVLDIRDMTHEASNGYLWYMIEPDMWIAAKEGDWTVFHAASVVDDRDQKIEDLEAEVANLKAQNEVMSGKLNQIHEISG